MSSPLNSYYEDRLDTATGIITGILIGIAMWAAIIGGTILTILCFQLPY